MRWQEQADKRLKEVGLLSKTKNAERRYSAGYECISEAKNIFKEMNVVVTKTKDEVWISGGN